MRDNFLRPLTQTKTILGDGELTMDAWGKAKVINDYSIIAGLFTFDIPPRIWVLEEDGVEVLTISTSTRNSSINGELVMTSGPTLGNSSHLHTRRHPRYQPNRGHIYSASVFLPGKNLQGERNFGIFNDEDGIFFRLKSDGKLYAVMRSLGVDVLEQEIINLPPSFDVEKGNTYDIQMQWRGVGDVMFFVGDPATGRSKYVHSFDLLGTRDNIIVSNPALAASFTAINQGDDVTIKCGCVDVSSEGGGEVIDQFATVMGNSVLVINEVALAIKVPKQLLGKTNTRDIRNARLTISTDKKGSFSVYTSRDATALTITTGAFVPIGIGNVEVFRPLVGTDSTFDTNKANLILSRPMQANTNEYVTNPQPAHIDAYLTAGDYLYITARDSGAGATVQCAFEYGEEV